MMGDKNEQARVLSEILPQNKLHLDIFIVNI